MSHKKHQYFPHFSNVDYNFMRWWRWLNVFGKQHYKWVSCTRWTIYLLIFNEKYHKNQWRAEGLRKYFQGLPITAWFSVFYECLNPEIYEFCFDGWIHFKQETERKIEENHEFSWSLWIKIASIGGKSITENSFYR